MWKNRGKIDKVCETFYYSNIFFYLGLNSMGKIVYPLNSSKTALEWKQNFTKNFDRTAVYEILKIITT